MLNVIALRAVRWAGLGVVIATAVGIAMALFPGTAPAHRHRGSVPINASPPRITSRAGVGGPPRPGQILIATKGVWRNRPTSFEYRWEVCDESGHRCKERKTPRSRHPPSYGLAGRDVGHRIRVVVTATNARGSTSARSAPWGVVARRPRAPHSGGGGASGCSPRVQQTMTNTVSHLCGFADTTNTGVPDGTILYRVPQDITAPKSDGSTGRGWRWNGYGIQTTAANAVIKEIKCSPCQVNITSPGSTLEDSNIANDGGAVGGNGAVQILGVNNVTIDHDTIHGVSQGNRSSSGWCGVGIQTLWVSGKDNPDNYSITNNNIYWCTNPTNNFINGGLFQNNYAHDFANSSAGAHYEAMQLESYVENGNLITIKDNTLLNQHTDQTAAIILSNDCNAPCTALPENNRLITHNLLAGGGYTFYGSASAGAPPSTNITFTNNHFSRIFAPKCGGWGPVTYWDSGRGNVWSGNVWDDTRRSVKP